MIKVIVIYTLVIFIIGYIASRRIKTSEDYFLGGKKFGPWMTAFKFSTTWESGSKLIGGPSMVYSLGMVGFIQGLFDPLGHLMAFRVWGRRVKIAVDYFKTITTPEILEKRYNSSAIRTVAAITIIIGLGGTLVAQYKAAGEVISVVLGIDYVTALVISMVLIAFYTIVGGYVASVWSDSIQGVVMLIGSILVFVFVAMEFSGGFTFAKLNAELSESFPHMLSMTGGGALSIDTIIALIAIPLFMGIALPQQSVAIYSMRDAKVGNASLIIAALFSATLTLTLFFSALISRTFLSVDNPDSLMPVIASEYLPPLIAGLFITAILAAIMSTVNGVILVAASAISRDIIKRSAPEAYEKSPVKWDRLSTIIMTIIPFLIAIKPPSIVFWIIAFSFGLVIFTFLMPMLGLIFWKRATKKAALIQMIATLIIMPLWTILGEPYVSGMFLGLIISPTIFIIASLLTKQDSGEIEVTTNLWREYKTENV